MLQIYDWDTKEYHGQIPQAAETYNVIGNINEYQVTIGETTFGELYSPPKLNPRISILNASRQCNRFLTIK